METLDSSQFQIIFQLVLAIILGGLVGVERESKGKGAGLQTYSLVSLGACLFTIISFGLFNQLIGSPNISLDPSRVVQAVAVGIGFLGAGVIFRRPSRVEGLTTVAGLWVAAAVGIAVWANFYFLAVSTVLLTIIILAGFGFLEGRFFRKDSKD